MFKVNKRFAAFFLINFNNKKDILYFLAQFRDVSIDSQVDFFVLNNGGNKREWLNSSEVSENVKIYSSDENMGYLNGANFLKQKLIDSYKFYILCNSDIQLDSRQMIYRLSTKKYEDDICVISPRIESPQVSNQNPFLLKRPTKKDFIKWKLIYNFQPIFLLYFWLSEKKKTLSYVDRGNVADDYPYALHGSFLIFRQIFFDNGGTLEYGSFLFGEEIFIANEVEKMNGRMYLDSKIEVFHDEHSSTGRLSLKFRRENLKKSIAYLYGEIYEKK